MRESLKTLQSYQSQTQPMPLILPSRNQVSHRLQASIYRRDIEMLYEKLGTVMIKRHRGVKIESQEITFLNWAEDIEPYLNDTYTDHVMQIEMRFKTV